jgi:protein-disulfide isomerase
MKKILLTLSLLFVLSACTGGGSSLGTVSSETRTIAAPTLGSWKHTVEIFADFQCPACINFNKTIGPVLEWYAEKGQLQIVYRQYPLTQIHDNAFRDAMAALCSAEQNKYQEYKSALYSLEESKAGAAVSDTDRVALAKTVGLDEAQMTTCLASNAYEAQVNADIARGESMNVNATPTIMLDGKKLDLWAFRDLNMVTKFFDQVVAQ